MKSIKLEMIITLKILLKLAFLHHSLRIIYNGIDHDTCMKLKYTSFCLF